MSTLQIVRLAGCSLAAGVVLGLGDEILFVLGLAPLLGGIGIRTLGRPVFPRALLSAGSFILALWFGRYLGAEWAYTELREQVGVFIESPASNSFNDFLQAEVGEPGWFGFLQVRWESGLRVLGDRGLNLGPGGFLVQLAFELSFFLYVFMGGTRGGERYTNTEELEQ